MALTQVLGDFPDAVKASSEVLKIAGRIYPSTTANVALEATLANGARVVGETRISRSQHRIHSIRLRPRKVPPAARRPHRHRRSRRDHPRPRLALHQRRPQPAGGRHCRRHPFVAGPQVLLRQPDVAARGDHEFRASDHVRAIHRHAGGKLLDYAVVNIRSITSALKNRYARQAALPVENDIEALMKLDLKVMAGNLSSHTEKMRHDPDATAAVVDETGARRPAPQERIMELDAKARNHRDPRRRSRHPHEEPAGQSAASRRRKDSAPARRRYRARAGARRSAFSWSSDTRPNRCASRWPLGHRLYRADRAEGHGPRGDDRPRVHGAPGWLSDGALRRFAPAAGGNAAPADRAGDRKAPPPAS